MITCLRQSLPFKQHFPLAIPNVNSFSVPDAFTCDDLLRDGSSVCEQICHAIPASQAWTALGDVLDISFMFRLTTSICLTRLFKSLLKPFLLIINAWEIRKYLSLRRVLDLVYKSASLKAFLNYFVFQVGQVMRVMKFAERWAASADPSLVRHFIFTLLEACIPPFSSDFASSLIRSYLYLSHLSLTSYVLRNRLMWFWRTVSETSPYVGWHWIIILLWMSSQSEAVSNYSSQWYCWTFGESHMLMKTVMVSATWAPSTS